jgi:CHASE2 domain-containing sensor protein
MQIPDDFIFAWRRWQEKISPYVNRYTIDDPARLALWSVLLSLTMVVLCSLGELDPDRSVIKSFFKLRGVVSPPEKVQLVAFTRKDFAPPLSLSPKYRITEDQFQTLITRILKEQPKKVIIDEAVLPEKEELQDIESILKSPLVTVYLEELYEIEEPYLIKALNLSRKVETDNNKAPILSTNQLVTRLPQQSSMYPSNDGNSLINFYGPAGTLKAFSFSDIMVGEGNNLSSLHGKIIFIGRQTSVFNRGHRVTKYSKIPLNPVEMSHLEIQATAYSNVINGTYIKILSKKAYAFALAAVFILSLIIMFLNYWVALPAMLLLSIALLGIGYLLFSQSLLWFEGAALFLILPAVVFLVASLITAFEVARKDKETKKDYFLD